MPAIYVTVIQTHQLLIFVITYVLCVVYGTGVYCRGGRVAGPCSAGYICYSNSDTPTPDGSNPVVGELCPFGYYCLEGNTC